MLCLVIEKSMEYKNKLSNNDFKIVSQLPFCCILLEFFQILEGIVINKVASR